MRNTSKNRLLAYLASAFFEIVLTGCVADPSTVNGRLGSCMSAANPDYSSEGPKESLLLWERPNVADRLYCPAVKGLCAFCNEAGEVWGIQAAYWSDSERKLHCLIDVDVPETFLEPPEKPTEDYLTEGDIALQEYHREPREWWGDSTPNSLPLWRVVEGNERLKKNEAHAIHAAIQSYDDFPIGDRRGISREIKPLPPEDMESYLYWFAGLFPHPSRFPTEKGRLQPGDDLGVRGTFIRDVLGRCFASFDLTGLDTPGFRKSLKFRFMWDTEVEVSRLDERRVRIEASIYFKKLPAEDSIKKQRAATALDGNSAK